MCAHRAAGGPDGAHEGRGPRWRCRCRCAAPCMRRPSSSSEGMDDLTLRFLAGGTEAGFVQSNRPRLQKNLLYVSCALLAVLVVSALVSFAWLDPATTAEAGRMSQVTAGIYGLGMASAAGVVVCLKVGRLAARIGAFALERLAVALVLGALAGLVFLDPQLLAAMFGYNLATAWGSPQINETSQLLSVQIVVVVAHFIFPIRGFLLASVEVIGMLFCPLMVCLRGPAVHPIFSVLNSWLLACSVAVTLLGKRSMERAERRNFLAVARERSLRAETEFQLDTFLRLAKTTTRARTPPASLPDTTSTGRIFVQLGEAAEDATADPYDVPGRLEEVAALGMREGWLLDAAAMQMHVDECLGSGGFGRVVGATYFGTHAAVKFPKHPKGRVSASHLRSLANEVEILRKVRHPNVVIFFGACIEAIDSRICVVLERVMGDSFSNFVSRRHPVDDTGIRKKLLLDVGSALWYLHAQHPQIVHSDLKPSNIMVELPGPRAKLLDFGLSRLLTKNVRPRGGTLNWKAPELIVDPSAVPRPDSDVFSFGRLAYVVVAARAQLHGMNRENIVASARLGHACPLVWPREVALREEGELLCRRALALDPARRPSMAEVHGEVAAWGVPQPDPPQEAQVATQPPAEAAECGAAAAARPPTPPDDELADLAPGLPHRRVTSPMAQLALAVTWMQRCNVPVPPGTCCLWHASARALASAASRLGDQPCNRAFLPWDDFQCPHCLVLNDADECDLCNGSEDDRGNSQAAGGTISL